MNPAELEQITFGNLGDSFLMAATRAVFLARRQTWNICQAEFAATETENTGPYVMRAKLEGLLRDAAERHGLPSEVRKPAGQPWNHSEVYAGPIVLTAATVATPGAMVDPADYRMGLAVANEQLTLWGASTRAQPSDLYGVLLHSRFIPLPGRQPQPQLPGSAYLAYPAADFSHYVYAVDLFDRYRHVVEDYLPQDWDKPQVELYLKQSKNSALA